MSSLTLVRHGQASFAVDRYDELSPLGTAQARALGERLRARSARWTAIRHGPRRRHVDTAAEIVRHAGLSIRPEVDHGLEEFAEGEEILDAAAVLFGRPMRGPDAAPRAELLRSYEAAYRAWASGELEIAGRESYAAFRARVRRWLDERIGVDRARGGQHVVAVTSAGVISALVCDVLGLPDAQWSALIRVIENASLTELLYSNGRCGLRSYNCTGHLPPSLVSAI